MSMAVPSPAYDRDRAKREPRPIAGRVPPNNLDAEGAVLCAILEQPAALDVCAEILSGPEDFYSHANGWVYRAACETAASGVRVDVITVCNWLRDREELERVGGRAYVQSLMDETPYVANVAEHATIVAELAKVRRLIAGCQRIAAEGYGDIGSVPDFLAAADEAVHAIASSRDRTRAERLGVVLTESFKRLESGDDADRGLPTGLIDLDRIAGRMKPGQLIVIGALSSVGKSSLALNIAVHVACIGRTPAEPAPAVLAFSLEMTKEELAERALFCAARVDSWKINAKKSITDDDWDALTAAAAAISPATLWIDDRQGVSPADIRASARRLQAEAQKRGDAKLAMLVVDYVQLVNGRVGLAKNASREQEVSAVGLALKNLAKELGVPVVALAQLNDDINKRPESERKPRMGDLRESKALAQHADKVILIHNPAAVKRSQELRDGHARNDDVPPPEVVELVVGKNRGGRTGSVRALFFPAFTSFQNYDGRQG